MLDEREEGDIDGERDKGEGGGEERYEGSNEGDRNVSGEREEQTNERYGGSCGEERVRDSALEP